MLMYVRQIVIIHAFSFVIPMSDTCRVQLHHDPYNSKLDPHFENISSENLDGINCSG